RRRRDGADRPLGRRLQRPRAGAAELRVRAQGARLQLLLLGAAGPVARARPGDARHRRSHAAPLEVAMPSHFAVAAAVAAALVSIPKTWSPRERAAADQVSAAGLAAHVRFLADDLLEGRAPGTRGSQLAMRYIAAEM